MWYGIGGGLLVVAATLTFLVLAWGSSGKLRRNPYLGIRTPETRKSDSAWLEAHHAALLASAAYLIATVIAGIAALVQMADDSSAAFAFWLGLVAFIGGQIFAWVKGNKAAKASK